MKTILLNKNFNNEQGFDFYINNILSNQYQNIATIDIEKQGQNITLKSVTIND